METSPQPSFTIEFEDTLLSLEIDENRKRFSRRKIGWLVRGVEVNSASIRYRCFHFARVLSPEFESHYYSNLNDLKREISSLDAVVIVKRLDRFVPELVAAASTFGVPVFLDLCDDLLHPRYVKNDYQINLLTFRSIAPLLAGVTVPSAAMASRIQSYAQEIGTPDVPIHVIPDIAETQDIFRATWKSVTGDDFQEESDETNATERRAASDLRRVIWFGNYGASHSDFGIYTLKPTLKHLRTVHEDIPLELVVVSNNQPIYDALVRQCGFPTRYVPWSANAVYEELGRADVALLTTGQDDFSVIKSSNRILQALAANVPVITTRGSAVTEFEGIVFFGTVEPALRQCLGPSRATVVASRQDAARPILDRYTPERLSGIWASLLRAAIGRGKKAPSPKQNDEILFVFDIGDKFAEASAAIQVAKRIDNLGFSITASIELVEEEPKFAGLLRNSSTAPRFFSRDTMTAMAARTMLFGCSTVIVGSRNSPTGSALVKGGLPLGITIMTFKEAANAGLERLGRLVGEAPQPSRQVINPGPYPERDEADGTVDWAFIINEKANGWILDAICREIGSRQQASWRVVSHKEDPPTARNIWFSHFALLEDYARRYPELLRASKTFVWYTHPRDETPSVIAQRLLLFEKVTKVVFTCEANRQTWLERGLPGDKSAVVLGAADATMFPYHERGNGVVGLSSSFYERKNPDCLLEVIRLLPHREFVLLGRKWNEYACFEEMLALPNFSYHQVPYSKYPDYYARFDVFLSMSNLEGGPIPLVEAMMCNAVPVASRTGFAPELITDGETGFIFDLDAPATVVADKIEAAFALEGNIRQTVERYDWDHFSAAVVQLAQ